jgi:phospholipid/cholesterol/gamma-HCH transport system permease protein
VAISLAREIAPLVTGLLVSGRVGAGIGAELGGMRVTEQIDALESLAVDSFKYLVVTRVLGCIIAQPILTTFMSFTGIVGGFVAETVISNLSFKLYVDRAFSGIEFVDYSAGCVVRYRARLSILPRRRRLISAVLSTRTAAARTARAAEAKSTSS